MTTTTVTVDSAEYEVESAIASVILTAQQDASDAQQQADIAAGQGENEIAQLWIEKANKANSFTISLISYYFDSIR